MTSTTLAAQIEAHRSYLVRYARSRINDPHAAEDLAQDTLLAALTASPGFQNRSTLRTWLTGILKHKITDMRRIGGREPNISSILPDASSDEMDALFHAGAGRAHVAAWPAWPARESEDPCTGLARERLMRDLRAGLKTLPPNQRSALELREFAGLSTDEICRTLDVSSSNFWVMICRAKASMRKSLGEHYGSLAA